MARAILVTLLSLSVFVGMVVFLVRWFLTLPAKLEEQLDIFFDSDEEEFILKKRKVFERQFGRLLNIFIFSLAVSIACSFLDGMVTPSGVSVAFVVTPPIVCVYLVFACVYFHKFNRKYDLRYRWFFGRDNLEILEIAAFPALPLFFNILINAHSIFLLFTLF